MNLASSECNFLQINKGNWKSNCDVNLEFHEKFPFWQDTYSLCNQICLQQKICNYAKLCKMEINLTDSHQEDGKIEICSCEVLSCQKIIQRKGMHLIRLCFLKFYYKQNHMNWQYLYESYGREINFVRIMSLVYHKKSYLVCAELLNLRILHNIYLFSSSCLCPLLAVSVLYFEKKLGIGCVNIQKFVNSTHTK